MGSPEEQRRSSWASRLTEAHRKHIEAHRGSAGGLRRDAEEHRRRILEAARRLFAEQGIEAVSMRQIALAAGVGQGTLYRRYASKGDLCVDLLQERQERFIEDVYALLKAQAAAPALTRLGGVLALMVDLLEEKADHLKEVAASHLLDPNCGDDDDAERNIHRHYGRRDIPGSEGRPLRDAPDGERHTGHHGMRDAPWYRLPHEVFVGLLSEAIERDELLPLDVEYTADAIMGALNPMIYRLQRQELGYSRERILQGLRHIFIEGIQPT